MKAIELYTLNYSLQVSDAFVKLERVRLPPQVNSCVILTCNETLELHGKTMQNTLIEFCLLSKKVGGFIPGSSRPQADRSVLGQDTEPPKCCIVSGKSAVY